MVFRRKSRLVKVNQFGVSNIETTRFSSRDRKQIVQGIDRLGAIYTLVLLSRIDMKKFYDFSLREK
ncbi:Hypothetical protein CpMEX30_1218 [Corynebacterium pseudotuberculosis]|uniref:Uncharacterized protein n=1 Tax=Corynebacterium pseudotuberculosis 258 TaxID=1168865 RepID=A0AAU8PQR7_CORPS|nr:hypothetical protein CP258_06015 [Corynebacterium pseudotuberculosis 258]AKS13502.1 Hypothetical protein CpE19_1164 [Corynebacterium pseudotuberculosis]AMN73394.1 hypothetical protein ATN04_02870 [Corynebacterium pseudotuberculosis]AMN76435.1 hypothetical protein ATN05_09260 [Corynebacterium pseudotuberculosis]APQ54256.1 Hypothetical protein CpMEX30_1218 [Corynebacterium pseudotuberculosis]